MYFIYVVGSEISTTERIKFLRIGSTLMAACNYEGVPASIVQWIYNGSVLNEASNPKLLLSFNSSRMELTIMRVSHAEVSSLYTCMASNEFGSQNISITAQILRKFFIIIYL